MGKVKVPQTTTVGDRVYFAGEVDVPEKEAGALKDALAAPQPEQPEPTPVPIPPGDQPATSKTRKSGAKGDEQEDEE